MQSDPRLKHVASIAAVSGVWFLRGKGGIESWHHAKWPEIKTCRMRYWNFFFIGVQCQWGNSKGRCFPPHPALHSCSELFRHSWRRTPVSGTAVGSGRTRLGSSGSLFVLLCIAMLGIISLVPMPHSAFRRLQYAYSYRKRQKAGWRTRLRNHSTVCLLPMATVPII